MRRYIRHPSDIPIEFDLKGSSTQQLTDRMTNISLGGVAFHSPQSIELDSVLYIRFPVVAPEFKARCRVVWCTTLSDGYEIGVELLDKNEAFQARMIEQVCHIEHYKREIEENEGRQLTGKEAAQEWIGKYAADFPRIDELVSDSQTP